MKFWVCAALMLGTMLGTMLGKCWADTIHLKDGTTLSADNVTEKDGQIQYTVGGTQYSIPKSSVSSIDHGNAFGISVGTSKSGWIAPSADSGPSRPASGVAHKVSHSQLSAALPREPEMRGVDSVTLSSKVVNFDGVNKRAL